MESTETQEAPVKETRGRPPMSVELTIKIPSSACQAVNSLMGKRMRQAGRFFTPDEVIIEAVQHYAKTFTAQE